MIDIDITPQELNKEIAAIEVQTKHKCRRQHCPRFAQLRCPLYRRQILCLLNKWAETTDIKGCKCEKCGKSATPKFQYDPDSGMLFVSYGGDATLEEIGVIKGGKGDKGEKGKNGKDGVCKCNIPEPPTDSNKTYHLTAKNGEIYWE